MRYMGKRLYGLYRDVCVIWVRDYTGYIYRDVWSNMGKRLYGLYI